MALRVGFVGVGGIAKRHLASSKKRDDIQIVGLADVNVDIAKQMAQQFGGNVYGTATELYDKEKPDAVVICTPPFAHGDIEEEAAKRGIHMFIEKPVAVNLKLAKQVKKAVDKAGVLVQVGYMFRFAKGVKKVKELLAKRKVAMVQQHYYMPGMPAKGWWAKMAMGGGQLIEQATHMLDLGRFLAGDVVGVSGRTTQAHDWTPKTAEPPKPGLCSAFAGVDIPDTTALTMTYESGAIGTLSCSMVPQAKWDNGFKVVAEGLLITIENGAAVWAGEEQGSEAAGEDWPNWVYYDFIDAVKEGRKQTTVPYSEGIKSLAISVAGYESANRKGANVNPNDLIKKAGIKL
ncbi:MAG: Gfo/Idh/MocA family oxidoreductase [Planctomycetota bacterium]